MAPLPALSVALAALLSGCSQPAAGPRSAATELPPADAGATPVIDAEPEPPMSEVEARVALSEMFRDAGFRILYDRPVALGELEVAVDGWDPQRRVGFEYVAAEEVEQWPGELGEIDAGDAEARLLVAGPGPRAEVLRQAREFLASLPDQESE